MRLPSPSDPKPRPQNRGGYTQQFTCIRRSEGNVSNLWNKVCFFVWGEGGRLIDTYTHALLVCTFSWWSYMPGTHINVVCTLTWCVHSYSCCEIKCLDTYKLLLYELFEVICCLYINVFFYINFVKLYARDTFIC